ncbi:MAG: YHS domain-containing protein [Propionicimonas sp.]|uniref:YHS domain-containing protein n=1 Tax=Propionicimonas sp. TaxID=1955623 RepID=UPI002B219864|nr:YHS domain-containing protein [Propionicimonas sp.]MEA4945278.1 YHS domain-containing protein [Propionicimonas sp.]MEA5053762.1 YHS domain-containing protein [Propionicimonas sp.]MEA5119355.1 YHS domain-containing protein [Propionicimonas sp.]
MAQPQCPVCGAPVDPETAPSESVRDELYYFCSPACHDQFIVNPGAFVEVPD